MDKEKLLAFLNDLAGLAKKHNISFSACSCCSGVNLDYGDQAEVADFLYCEPGSAGCRFGDQKVEVNG